MSRLRREETAGRGGCGGIGGGAGRGVGGSQGRVGKSGQSAVRVGAGAGAGGFLESCEGGNNDSILEIFLLQYETYQNTL